MGYVSIDVNVLTRVGSGLLGGSIESLGPPYYLRTKKFVVKSPTDNTSLSTIRVRVLEMVSRPRKEISFIRGKERRLFKSGEITRWKTLLLKFTNRTVKRVKERTVY